MKKLLSLIICLLCALNLCADVVLTIKGKGKQRSLKRESQSGPAANIGVFKKNLEISFRPKKKFQTVKAVFKVLNDDELSFSFGGGYIRSNGIKKNDFEWIDCSFLRINGKELIGPNAGKEGKKITPISKTMALKEKIKVKKGDKLTVEMEVRATSKKDAKKLDAEKNMSSKKKREAEKEKARAEKERDNKSRKEQDKKTDKKSKPEKEKSSEKSSEEENQESQPSESGEDQ